MREPGQLIHADTGPAPSFPDMCHVQWGPTTFAAATDPDSAYSWNCFLLATAYGTSQAGPLRALRHLARFLADSQTRQLIEEVVVGGHGLPAGQVNPVTFELGALALNKYIF